MFRIYFLIGVQVVLKWYNYTYEKRKAIDEMQKKRRGVMGFLERL